MNLFLASIELIAPRLGMTLAHSLWEGAVTAIALGTALRLLGGWSAAVRYAAACAALGLFGIAVAVTFVELAPAPAMVQPRAVSVVDTTPVRLPPVVVTARALPPILEVSQAQVSARPLPERPIDPLRWAGLLWLIGAFAVAMWHLAGWLWIGRCVRGIGGRELDGGPLLGKLIEQLGIRRAVRLVETARLNVPAVIGVFRPVILIPLGFLNDLTPDQVEAILIHELAHIRRHDYLVNLFQVVAESLLFYHPAVWWISSQIRREREHCCDDIAASRFTVKSYVSALLALEQRRWPLAGPLVAATGGTLLERVRRLVGDNTRIKRRRPVRSALAAAVVLGCVCLPIGMQGCDKSKPSAAASSPASPSSTAVVSTDANVKSEGITADDLKPDYSVERIGPGDILEVSIYSLTGVNDLTTKRCLVSDPDGKIDMPLIDNGIKVAGLTEPEAQAAISKAYKEARVIVNAMVSVTRAEIRSATYTVLGGGVVTPGEFVIRSPNTRLTDALCCGAVRLSGHKAILISRKVKDSGTRTLKIPVADLMSGDSQVNVFMRPGDIVMLSPSVDTATTSPTPPAAEAVDHGQYYVGGDHISRGGTYPIPAGNITLKQAIIAAGGAETGFISLQRRDGVKESLTLDNAAVSDLNSGVMADVTVHAGDTITVTGTPRQWLGATTQQAVTP